MIEVDITAQSVVETNCSVFISSKYSSAVSDGQINAEINTGANSDAVISPGSGPGRRKQFKSAAC